MTKIATLADLRAIQDEMTWSERDLPKTIFGVLNRTAEKFGSRKAVTFQLTSEPKDRGETFTWSEFREKVAQAANLFRSLGIGENDPIAYVMPNCNETAIAFVAGMTAGIVAPVNPLLEPEQIAAMLNQTGAKVVVTLKAFPKTDVPQKVAKALTMAPSVQTVLEVDLLRYLGPPKSWIVPLIRPKPAGGHEAKVLDFNAQIAKCDAGKLDFKENDDSARVGALFHTGGTTGMP